MSIAFTTKQTGPRGGNLENPATNPERRESDFKSNLQGEVGMHRFAEPSKAVVGLKNEQPWHTMAAFMLLAGRTNSEIAASAGVTVQAVTTLRAQRWFQEKLALLANSEGDEILGTVKAEALSSVQKLVELRDGAESERIQLSAALALLEHAHGKPTQKVISVSTRITQSPEDEARDLEAQLEALRSRRQTTIS